MNSNLRVLELLDLPECILYKIFLELKIETDLFHVLSTCEYFRSIVHDIWRREKKTKIDQNYYKFKYLEKSHFVELVTAHSEQLKELRTFQLIEPEYDGTAERLARLERLSCIRHLVFHNLTFMQCALDFELPASIDFAKVMPALAHLSMYFYCKTEPLEVKNVVASVRTITNLRQLESLQINYTYLNLILNELLQLPHMCKVVAFIDDRGADVGLLNRIADLVGHRTTTVTAAISDHWRDNFECLRKFSPNTNINLLVKYTHLFCIPTECNADNCPQILLTPASLPNMVRLQLNNWYIGTLHDFWTHEKEGEEFAPGEYNPSTHRYPFANNLDYNNFNNAPEFYFCCMWTELAFEERLRNRTEIITY